MQELEKILEEIDETIERYGENPYIDEKVTDLCYGLNIAKDIIRKHMNDDTAIGINIDDERLWKILFDEACVEGKQAERIYAELRKIRNDGWIPCDDRLPSPNKEVWVTVIRNGKAFTSTDSMTEKGHFWNYEKSNILAWKEKESMPEPYRPEKGSVKNETE